MTVRKELVFIATALCVIIGLSGMIWAAPQKVAINALWCETPDWTLLEDNIGEFYKTHPNISVDFTFLSHAQMIEKLKIELSVGSPAYDSLYCDNLDLSTFAQAGWIDPIPEDIIDIELGDFPPGFVEALKYKGKYYGLPFYIETQLLFFRTDLLGEYGVYVPKTFEELKEAARKLTLDVDGDDQTDIYGYVTRGQKFPGYVNYTWIPFMKGYGTDYFDKDWNVTINNKAAKNATRLWAELAMKYSPPGISGYAWHEALSAFNQGTAAFYIDASVFGPRMQDPKESAVAGKVGYALVPFGPVGAGLGLYCPTHVINSKSKHKKETLELNLWTFSKGIDRLVATPARISTYKLPDVQKKFDFGPLAYKYLDAMVENMKYAEQHIPKIPEWAEIGSVTAVELSKILAGEKTVDKALDDAAKVMHDVMKKAGYYD